MENLKNDSSVFLKEENKWRKDWREIWEKENMRRKGKDKLFTFSRQT